jgi:hypothetical protein
VKNVTFDALNAHMSQHPVVRPFNEIAVWSWIAGAVLIVLLLTAMLAPTTGRFAGAPSPLLLPPIGQPAVPTPDITTNPAL